MQVEDGVHAPTNACSKQQSGPTQNFEPGLHLLAHWQRPLCPAMSEGAIAMSGVAHVDEHAPAQHTCDPVHAAPPHKHFPPEQCAPPEHAVMQSPQWKSSLIKLLQPSAPQHDWPLEHVVDVLPPAGQPQLPAAHTWPAGHVVPQSPQFLLSKLITSMQLAPQHLPPH
jgi:hypothetical protein